MKKIFLLVGIAAFSSSTAQQKELFDINKYIQKKQVEKKKAAEKEKLILHSFRTNYNTGNYYFSNKPDLTYTLSNGDRVITLLQDNMPCIVPDMKQFQTMPNGGNKVGINNYYRWKRNMPGIIPNGSMPFRMIAYTRVQKIK